MVTVAKPIDRMFADLKRGRRGRVGPIDQLTSIGNLSTYCLDQLQHIPRLDVSWTGSGAKTYKVSVSGSETSRGINMDLFETEPAAFNALWVSFLTAARNSQGKRRLRGISAEVANKAAYTALMAFSSYVDITRRNNAQPGTFLEMIVGPTISILSGRPEKGSINVPIAGSEFSDTVTVDLSFPFKREGEVEIAHRLVMPTKMSTRERISQAYVHHRILSSANIGAVDTVLCAANETNKKEGGLSETLVPQTIALYEKYIGNLSALVYLDPPVAYLGGLRGLPPVMHFGEFLTKSSGRGSLAAALKPR